MCRHLAYLGRPRPLRDLLCDPPHALLRQSFQPRRQAHGRVNADGFGVGWYADADPVPARYRRDVPMWTDGSFLDVARVVRSGAVLLWQVLWRRLRGGEPMPAALAGVVRLAAGTAGGRLNLLLTDGRSIAATTWGDRLSWRADPGGVVVASEPYDDEPGWVDVPDRCLLVASPDGVDVTPLDVC